MSIEMHAFIEDIGSWQTYAAATLKARAFENDYAPTYDEDDIDDITGTQIGSDITLTGVSWDTTGGIARVLADDPHWSSLTGDIAAVVIYHDASDSPMMDATFAEETVAGSWDLVLADGALATFDDDGAALNALDTRVDALEITSEDHEDRIDVLEGVAGLDGAAVVVEETPIPIARGERVDAEVDDDGRMLHHRYVFTNEIVDDSKVAILVLPPAYSHDENWWEATVADNAPPAAVVSLGMRPGSIYITPAFLSLIGNGPFNYSGSPYSATIEMDGTPIALSLTDDYDDDAPGLIALFTDLFAPVISAGAVDNQSGTYTSPTLGAGSTFEVTSDPDGLLDEAVITDGHDQVVTGAFDGQVGGLGASGHFGGGYELVGFEEHNHENGAVPYQRTTSGAVVPAAQNGGVAKWTTTQRAQRASDIPLINSAVPTVTTLAEFVDEVIDPIAALADGDYVLGVAVAGSEGEFEWVAPGGGGGSVATDAIFDAKGDLAVGTGSDTADNLTVGANDTILMADSSQTTGLKWGNAATVKTALALVKGDVGLGNVTNDAQVKASWAPTRAYVTNDQTWTNDTTLANITGLTQAIGASETWFFDVNLHVNGAGAGDVKTTITAPAGATAEIAVYGVTTGGTTAVVNAGQILTPGTDVVSTGTNGTTNRNLVRIVGCVFNSTNAGSVTVQAAQDTSSGTATTVRKGSTMKAERLA